MIKVVAFDFDNTLEVWIPIEEHAEKVAAKYVERHFKLPADAFKEIFDAIKMGYVSARSLPQDYSRKYWFSEALAHFGIYDGPVSDLVDLYWEEMLKGIEPFPGVYDVLTSLKRKYKLAMLSDSDGDPFWKDIRIKKLKMEKYFDVILTSHEVGVNKPHPRGFRRICSELNAKPNQCVMVGDNAPIDLKTPKSLGFHTIWTRQGFTTQEERNRTFPFADFTVDTITEVPDIVEKKIEKVRHQSTAKHIAHHH